ncbi:MAG: SsrA-binding protein SmpB [Eubacteriaceae bacterium]|nr:SsrA-binding protein SmpB [Eubacteriaceae bacterium]
MKNDAFKLIQNNRSAYHEYYIEEKIEAGLSLYGTEVKSIRQNKVNLKDSFAYIKDGEAFVAGMHISPYEQGNIFNKDPLRVRRLLLNKREIRRLKEVTQKQGYTLIPTDIHFKGPYAKLTIGIAKGKKLYDKRDTSAKRDASRDIQRAMKRDS